MIIKPGVVRKVEVALEKLYTVDRISKEEFILMNELKSRLVDAIDQIDRQLERITEDCTGEAHSNAFIDNCMICAPLWGKVLKERNRER